MYIVIEMQYSSNDTVSTLVNSYNDIYNAEWKYHQILSAAAISQIDVHSAILLDNFGRLIKSQYYDHREQNPIVMPEL